MIEPMQSTAVQLTPTHDYGGTREPFNFEQTVSESKKYGLQFYMHIPDADVSLVESKCNETFNATEKKEMQILIAQNRYSNRICNRYGLGCRNGTRENLITCSDCHLTFWCSEICKTLDSVQHKSQRCGKNAIDVGPLRIVFLNQ